MRTFNFPEENQLIQIRKSTHTTVFIGFVSLLIVRVSIGEKNTFGSIVSVNCCFNFFLFMALDDEFATLVTEMTAKAFRWERLIGSYVRIASHSRAGHMVAALVSLN
jgi:hypothetical protein